MDSVFGKPVLCPLLWNSSESSPFPLYRNALKDASFLMEYVECDDAK